MVSARWVEGLGALGGKTLPDGADHLWASEDPVVRLCYVAGQPLAPTAPCTLAVRGQVTDTWLSTRFRMQPL